MKRSGWSSGRWPDAAGRFEFVSVTDVGDVIASLKEPLRDLGATPKPS